MTIAIKVENLSKKYIIKHEKKSAHYETFSDTLIQGSKNIAKKIIHPFSGKKIDPQTQEEFWALNDINFEINQGDKVGIIGRNGAGKSTLLKVLSRITEPTSGKIHINGRIASLLEVGTGFHPELTGRENIYLNGAILGMSRKEIKAKFDEIVAFAEVDKFLDTPVKRYSSGMYVRLAFSVAAHLEPEILVVDEVLAVGDVEFQKKCLGKMGEVSKEGRTILFVSHNMNAIEQLCNHAILMEKGKLIKKSMNMRSIVQRYLSFDKANKLQSEWICKDNQYINDYFLPIRFSVENSAGAVIDGKFRNDEDIYIVIEGKVMESLSNLRIGYTLFDEENNMLYRSYHTDEAEQKWPTISKGHNKIFSIVPKRLLNEGMYRIELVIMLFKIKWIVEPQRNAPFIYFSIQGGLSDSPNWMHRRFGILAPVLSWKNK